jgi:hypothetical protein
VGTVLGHFHAAATWLFTPAWFRALASLLWVSGAASFAAWGVSALRLRRPSAAGLASLAGAWWGVYAGWAARLELDLGFGWNLYSFTERLLRDGLSALYYRPPGPRLLLGLIRADAGGSLYPVHGLALTGTSLCVLWSFCFSLLSAAVFISARDAAASPFSESAGVWLVRLNLRGRAAGLPDGIPEDLQEDLPEAFPAGRGAGGAAPGRSAGDVSAGGSGGGPPAAAPAVGGAPQAGGGGAPGPGEAAIGGGPGLSRAEGPEDVLSAICGGDLWYLARAPVVSARSSPCLTLEIWAAGSAPDAVATVWLRRRVEGKPRQELLVRRAAIPRELALLAAWRLAGPRPGPAAVPAPVPVAGPRPPGPDSAPPEEALALPPRDPPPQVPGP